MEQRAPAMTIAWRPANNSFFARRLRNAWPELQLAISLISGGMADVAESVLEITEDDLWAALCAVEEKPPLDEAAPPPTAGPPEAVADKAMAAQADDAPSATAGVEPKASPVVESETAAPTAPKRGVQTSLLAFMKGGRVSPPAVGPPAPPQKGRQVARGVAAAADSAKADSERAEAAGQEATPEDEAPHSAVEGPSKKSDRKKKDPKTNASTGKRKAKGGQAARDRGDREEGLEAAAEEQAAETREESQDGGAKKHKKHKRRKKDKHNKNNKKSKKKTQARASARAATSMAQADSREEPEITSTKKNKKNNKAGKKSRKASHEAGLAEESAAGVGASDVPTEVESCVPKLCPDVRCGRCKGPLDMVRAVISGKSAGSWRCHKCNTKGVQLSRLPGWGDFQATLKAFSPEQRAAFWKGTHQEAGPDGLGRFLNEQTAMISRHAETNSAKTGGTYLPLSVYERRGFDVDAIRRHCRDKRMHPVLGMVYRVALDEVFSGAQNETINETSLMKGSGSNMGSQAGSSTDGQPLPSAAGESSTTAPVTETPKPSPADARRMLGLATRILSKTGLVVVPLEVGLKSKHISKLPEYAVDSAKATLAELKELETQCKKTLRGAPVMTMSMSDANDLAPWPALRDHLSSCLY